LEPVVNVRDLTRLTFGEANYLTQVWSPDGRWLAYTSNESGGYQVYVRAFSDKSRPDSGGKWQISNAGGAYPVWARNGQELFFRADDNRMMVVTYTAKTDSFVPDKPRVWSNKRLVVFGPIGISNYSRGRADPTKPNQKVRCVPLSSGYSTSQGSANVIGSG